MDFESSQNRRILELGIRGRELERESWWEIWMIKMEIAEGLQLLVMRRSQVRALK